MNTIYFYDSNKGELARDFVHDLSYDEITAVRGCEFKDPEDAGNLQLDWLEVQLESFRQREMQVRAVVYVPYSIGPYADRSQVWISGAHCYLNATCGNI